MHIDDKITELLKRMDELISSLTEGVDKDAVLELARETRELRLEHSLPGEARGFWQWNLNNDSVYYSCSWRDTLGCGGDEIGTQRLEWLIRIHPDDVERVMKEMESWQRGEAGHYETEYRMLHRDGSYRWVKTGVTGERDANGKLAGLSGTLTDITDLRVYDPLTGLPNRALLLEKIRHCIAASRGGSQYDYALLLLSVDGYGIVNETMGHAAGDRLVVKIASTLQECVGEDGMIVRLGGAQFAVLMEEIDNLGRPSRIAFTVKKKLDFPFVLNDLEIFVDPGIGIALGMPKYQTPEQLLMDAGIAMQRAKKSGPGVEIFDRSMHTRAMSQLKFENELRRAIKRRELQLYYQPIVSMRTGLLTGFEALTRWKHPEKGFIAPSEFIPFAEEFGLINSLGDWALHEALEQNRAWRNEDGAKDLIMSVNFSALQFQKNNMLSVVSRALEDTGSDPEYLKIELTESAFMGTEETAIRTLMALKQLGVKLSIDDFGTGYSSLSYLKRFPVDNLKIDRSFIKDLPENLTDGAIIYAIVNMAHSLKLRVVAEGVHSAEQMKYLRMTGCDEAQGFYYSRPLPAEEATKLVLRPGPLVPDAA